MAMSGLSYAGSVANGLDFYSSRPLVPVRTQPCGASPGSSVGAGYFKLIDYVKQHELSVKPLRLSTSGAGRNVQNAASSEEEVSTLNATKYREPQKVFKERTNIYNYDPEIGKKVVAKVRKEGNIYKLKIEASFSEEETLCMEWDTFRSKSSGWKEPVLKELPVGTIQLNEGYQSTLQRVDSSNLCVELEFMSDLVPFYVRFRIFQASNKHADVPSARDSHFICPIGCGRGCPDPLGSTVRGDGSINFALYSQRASAVILCLYHEGNPQPLVELELQRSINKTGNTWHIELDGNMYDRYGYKCMGESSWEKGDRFHARRILLDPYAKIVAPFLPGQDSLPSPAVLLGLLSNDKEFEWGDDTSPNIPLEETVAYRLNIGGFTGDKSSGLPDHILGTFEGLANKSEHLKALGVNCIILQPIFYFKKKKGAYHPLSFFAPMDIFGPERTCASSSYSLKKAIRELHKNHIEVLLDVVFSHTGENNDESPENISFRGIDNATYYILDQDGRVTRTDLGSENSFNCNHPVAHSMIVDCLRHWVLEYHVDGFFFINSSALTKGPHREELTRPLLVEAISFDPILSKCKLLADISSPFTGTYKDMKFPHWKRWCLWNNTYRKDVRQFMRGDKGKLSSFATRLCGSGDILADGRGPNFSLNHITSPYGLTLVDLVSYSATMQADSEQSWNCGEEGRTLNQTVLNIRVRQVRNYLMCLFLSQGIPVLNMGDEYGLSKGGSLAIDQRRSFNWDALKLDFGQQMSQLIASLGAFRARRADLFQRKEFLKLENIQWHGLEINQPDWENTERSFIAMSLMPEETVVDSKTGGRDIYVGFNSGDAAVVALIPDPPPGMDWKNELLECVRRRWDWFHKPIHAVAHLLHPLWRNEEAYLDNELEDNWLTYVKMWTGDDVHMIDQLEKERYAFRTNEKYFGNPTARLRENQLAPVTWWERFGLGTPLLRKLAIRVLSQDCSTGPAERNWSTWALFHTKKRNRLSSEQLERLVYCHCNLKLLEKKGNYTHPLQVNVDTIDISDVKDIPEIPHEERDIYSMLFKEQQRFVRQTRSKTSRAKACGNIMEASTSRHPRKFASRRGGGRGRRGASTSRHVDGPQDWEEISAESRSDEDLDEAAATIAAQFGLDSESSSWTSAFDEDEDEDLDEDVDSRV